MIEKTFADLGLSANLLKAVEKKGFITPSPIQAGVIPLLLNGNKDIIGQAQTGTGKTAAFALPLLDRIDFSLNKIQAIVLAPTRELAIQVAAEIESFSTGDAFSIQVIYGGNNIRGEISGLRKNPAIVVGTPGRIQHHIRNKDLRLDSIKYFILDEADEMLNFGFRSEIESILDLTPKTRRMLLFSATMPKSILDIVENYMGKYDTVKVASKEMTNENITQKYYVVDTRERFDALCRLLEMEENFYAIIFCRTKREVDTLAKSLKAADFSAEAIHGDVDQKKRERILHRFKTAQTKLLIATDVAARGIDVSELNYVVNYSISESYEIYTHRIGRTGRAGNKGTAITFVTPAQVHKLRLFERSLKVSMQRSVLPELKEVTEKKQQHLIQKIEHIVNNENLSEFKKLASSLSEEGDAVTIIAALLKKNHDESMIAQKEQLIAPAERSSTERTRRTSHSHSRSTSHSSRSSSPQRGNKNNQRSTKPEKNAVRAGKVRSGKSNAKAVKKPKPIIKARGPHDYPGSK